MAIFETVQKQLPHLDDKVTEARAKLETINAAILKSKQEMIAQEDHLKKYRDEVKAKEGQMESATWELTTRTSRSFWRSVRV